MIENVFFLTKDGILLHDKNYIEIKIESDLLAGFLSALNIFTTKTTQQQIMYIIMKNTKFSS